MNEKNKEVNLIEVRFWIPKDSLVQNAVDFFEKNYKEKTKSKTVQKALVDLKILFDFFNVRTFEGLLKKIGIKVNNNAKTT